MQEMERKKTLEKIYNLRLYGQCFLGISFASFVIMFTVCAPERMWVVALLGIAAATIGSIFYSKSVRERRRLEE
jgi:hypothetical protein